MWDLKMLDSIGSAPGESLAQRAAAVAFGATAPRARALVRGREERGVPGKAFCPLTGAGYVSQKKGDYDRPIKAGLLAEESWLVEVGVSCAGETTPELGAVGAARVACTV